MSVAEKLARGQAVCIVFLGDSITQGCFEGYSPADVGYTYRARFCRLLQEAYPAAVIHAINAGVSGDAVGLGLFRLQRDVLAHEPDLCVVCFGINDTTCCFLQQITPLMEGVKDLMDPVAYDLMMHEGAIVSYRYSMDQILKRLKQKQIPAIVLTPNGMNRAPIGRDDPVALVGSINGMLMQNGTMDRVIAEARAVAAENGEPLADGYARWKQLEEDGVITERSYANHTNHPTRELHGELAAVLFKTFIEVYGISCG